MNSTPRNFTEVEISAVARRFWEEEGMPEGKAEEHWHRAEQELRKGGQPISHEGSDGTAQADVGV